MSDLKQHYLERYAETENFINEYMEHLNNPNKKCPFADIDDSDTRDENFYKDLTNFLTKCLGNSRYKFEQPDKSKYPFAIKFRDMNVSFDEYIYLTSDQFGFSAPRKDKKYNKFVAWDREKSYPYARYLSVNCDDRGACDPKKTKFVAECIYETRTIGGSFIWPKVNTSGGYQSMYNCQRGIRGYIEDRVDITLYEISCFYDVYVSLEEKKYETFREKYENEYSENILLNKQCEDERRAIYRWLSTFETFEGYVKKLQFKNFVIQKEDKYLIRDMEKEGASVPLNIAGIKKIRDMNDKELHTLLMNVKECIQARSRDIEEFMTGRKPHAIYNE